MTSIIDNISHVVARRRDLGEVRAGFSLKVKFMWES